MLFIDHQEIRKIITTLNLNVIRVYTQTECLGPIPSWLTHFLFQILCKKEGDPTFGRNFDIAHLEHLVDNFMSDEAKFSQSLEKPIHHNKSPRLGFIVMQSYIDCLGTAAQQEELRKWLKQRLFPLLENKLLLKVWAEDCIHFASLLQKNLNQDIHPAALQLSKILTCMAMNPAMQMNLMPLIDALVEACSEISFSNKALTHVFSALTRSNQHFGAFFVTSDEQKARSFSQLIQAKLPLAHFLLRKGNEIGAYETHNEHEEHLLSYGIWLVTGEMRHCYQNPQAITAFFTAFTGHLFSTQILENDTIKGTLPILKSLGADHVLQRSPNYFNLILLFMALYQNTRQAIYHTLFSTGLERLPLNKAQQPVLDEEAQIIHLNKPHFFNEVLLSLFSHLISSSDASRALYKTYFNFLARFNPLNTVLNQTKRAPLSLEELALLTAACFKGLQHDFSLEDAIKNTLKRMLTQKIWTRQIAALNYKGQCTLPSQPLLKTLLDMITTGKSETKPYLLDYFLQLLEHQPYLIESLVNLKSKNKQPENHPSHQLTLIYLSNSPQEALKVLLLKVYDSLSDAQVSELKLLNVLENKDKALFQHLAAKCVKQNLKQLLPFFHTPPTQAHEFNLFYQLTRQLPLSVWGIKHGLKLLKFEQPTYFLLFIHLMLNPKAERAILFEHLKAIAAYDSSVFEQKSTNNHFNSWTPWMYLLDGIYYQPEHFTDEEILNLVAIIPHLSAQCWTEGLTYKGEVIEYPLRLLIGIIHQRPEPSKLLPLLSCLKQHAPSQCWGHTGTQDQSEVSAYSQLQLLFQSSTDKAFKQCIHRILIEHRPPSTTLHLPWFYQAHQIGSYPNVDAIERHQPPTTSPFF